MAVQKSRVSPSRRKMRNRANSRFTGQALGLEQETGVLHVRHHVAPNGYYRGTNVLRRAVDTKVEDSGSEGA